MPICTINLALALPSTTRHPLSSPSLIFVCQVTRSLPSNIIGIFLASKLLYVAKLVSDMSRNIESNFQAKIITQDEIWKLRPVLTRTALKLTMHNLFGMTKIGCLRSFFVSRVLSRHFISQFL